MSAHENTAAMNGGPFPELDEASIAQLQAAMAGGQLTAGRRTL